MDKEIKIKELQLREEKLKISRESLEFKKEIWGFIKNGKLTHAQAKLAKKLLRK